MLGNIAFEKEIYACESTQIGVGLHVRKDFPILCLTGVVSR